MAFPFVPQFRKNYVLTRWCCVACGWFERGDIIPPHVSNCPNCGSEAILDMKCSGETTRTLPFISKPRKESAPGEGAFQVTHAKGIVDRLHTDERSRRRGGLKATGRPKKKVQP